MDLSQIRLLGRRQSNGRSVNWRPPGMSAAACCELNARAHEAAGSITGRFEDAFDATLAKHSEWHVYSSFSLPGGQPRAFLERSYLRVLSALGFWRLTHFTSVRAG